MFTLSALAFALSGFFCVQVAFGAPIPHKRDTSPYYVVYNDEAATPPDPQDIEPFNMVNLAFLLSSGNGSDVAGKWEQLSDSDRQSTLQQYEQAGIQIMVSAFGGEDAPTTNGLNATAVANSMAQWVIQYGVHGVDVDYEDFAAFGDGSGPGADWVIAFMKALRQQLPQGKYLISHAPIAPWFKTDGGPYLKIHQEVGDLIDWYNVQFYNQGSAYTTCDALITTMNDTNNPALMEIVANGVPIEKLVIGKPTSSADAGSGYMSPTDLADCLAQAKQQYGYDSGIMNWQYHTDGSTLAWIKGVLGGTSGSSSSKRQLVKRRLVRRLSPW